MFITSVLKTSYMYVSGFVAADLHGRNPLNSIFPKFSAAPKRCGVNLLWAIYAIHPHAAKIAWKKGHRWHIAEK